MINKLIWTEEELQQGSEAWLRWRDGDNGITLGGSEVAPLMYLSPWDTPKELYLKKVGLLQKEFSEASMAAMNRGTELEPVARAYYEKQTRTKSRQLCAIHPTKPWMRTSLDGITDDNRVILEIKSPSSFDRHVKQTKGGGIPDYRYPQLQWQIAVMREHYAAVERVDYISYWEEHKGDGLDEPNLFVDMQIIPIYPNEPFIAEMIRRAEIFVRYLEHKIEPPPTIFMENMPLTLSYPTPRKKAGTLPAFF
jgi:putative phage-type endonuclease